MNIKIINILIILKEDYFIFFILYISFNVVILILILSYNNFRDNLLALFILWK